MVNVMVERATSDMLIGPDWARNIEICDICNYDPAQAKDIVKSIKKRLRSKNAKVQLLALTLLETIVKNCGDIVHMHVAQKELPHQMVKIVKKKPDFHVKEKILVLIDTWQEAFGGPRARYPQYFAAYQELLRLGAVFPQRSETSAPIFTPLQTHPLTSYPQNLRNPEMRPAAADSSAEAEFPTLSLTEIQNARGIMDVLAEMMNAIDPNNKEGMRQDVIVDLVEQCRTYKHRVVHLVNSTTDESLLNQGLALNDDLQRLLAKHESISCGAISIQSEKSKPDPTRPLVDIDAPFIDASDIQSDKGSTSSTSLGTQLLLTAPPETNGQSTTPTKVDPKIDLLSDGFNSPTANSQALVSAGEPQPVSSQHNGLDLVDMFSQSNNYQSPNSNIVQEAHPSSAHFPQQTDVESPQASSLYSQGSDPSSAWNGQITQQQQSASPVYGCQDNNAFPPPPWEAQLDESASATSHPHEPPSNTYLPGSQTMTNNHQVVGPYMQPITGSHLVMQSNQIMGPPYPQPTQPAYNMYPQHEMYGNAQYGYGYGYGQGQQQNGQFLEQGMSGMAVSTTSSYVPSGKPSKPEDKLFGDLVDISKFKPGKTTPG